MVIRSLSYLFKCILVSCIYSEEVDLKSTVFSFRFTFNNLCCLKHNVEVFPLHIHFMFSECSSLKCDETFIKPLGLGSGGVASFRTGIDILSWHSPISQSVVLVIY